MEKKRYTNTMMWRCYRLRIVGPTLIPLTVNASVTHTQRHSLSHGFSVPHHVSRSHWTHSLFLSLSFFFFVFILRAPFSISVLTLHFFLLHALTHRERGISVSSPIREVRSFLHSLIAFLFYYLGLGFRGFFLDLLDFFCFSRFVLILILEI